MDHRDTGMEDKLKAAGNKMKGSVKDVAGDVMNDRKMQADGKLDKLKGEAQEKLGEAKEHFSDAESRRDRL